MRRFSEQPQNQQVDLTEVMLMYTIKSVCGSIKNKKPLGGIWNLMLRINPVEWLKRDYGRERVERESDDENELNASLSGELNWNVLLGNADTTRTGKRWGENVFALLWQTHSNMNFHFSLQRFPVTGDSFVRVTEFSEMSVRVSEVCLQGNTLAENIPGRRISVVKSIPWTAV